MHRSRRPRRSASAVLATTASALLLASCGSDGSDGGAGEDADAASAAATTTAAAREVSGPQERLVVTYDGGILTLDADSLAVLSDEKAEGFLRLNPAGDGRHVLVSEADGFRLFDTGVWSRDHGDHSHSYATDPQLTDTVYEAEEPGHVVAHDGRTVLFGDGDGTMRILDTADPATAPEEVATETTEPHHGVAVTTADGTLVHTEGTVDERHTVVAGDVRNTDCPGVHGEAAAQGALVFGCEDGLLVYRDGAFTKVQADKEYARTGNHAGSEESTVVLGDYKTDEDAELERPTSVALTDTVAMTTKVVDLGTSYSFRSLGRGPEGEALVLGTDGKLHVLDPVSGEETAAWPVTDSWEEPEEWQEPRPTLFVQDDRAYVTDPETKELHVVDLGTGEILTTAELPETPNELTGVTG